MKIAKNISLGIGMQVLVLLMHILIHSIMYVMDGSFDDIQVVFDNDDGVAVSGEPPQDFGQFVDIGKVEAGCWFIQDVDCLSCAASAQFGRQFNPLGFAAR